MVSAAWGGAHDADRVVVLVDARRGIDAGTQLIIDRLRHDKRQAILALNKIDLVKRDSLLGLTAQCAKESLEDGRSLFSDTFMISALSGDGVDALRAFLVGCMPEGPWLYPEDQSADIPLRLLAAEITREKVFLQLSQELPYAAAVETEAWTERDDGSVRIDQIVYVRRDSQKTIVLGKAGRRIKAIGSAARAELEELLDRRVHLFLHVKVREGWQDDPERYRDLGLDYNV